MKKDHHRRAREKSRNGSELHRAPQHPEPNRGGAIPLFLFLFALYK